MFGSCIITVVDAVSSVITNVDLVSLLELKQTDTSPKPLNPGLISEIPSFKIVLHLLFCVLGIMCMCYGTYRGQRTTYGSQFSPSTTWILGIKLKPSSLAASAFIH